MLRSMNKARGFFLGFSLSLCLASAPALAFSSTQFFAGVTGGLAGFPIPSTLGNYSPTFVGTGTLGAEVGLESGYGWQLRLHGFEDLPVAPVVQAVYGGTLDARYVLPSGDPDFQPYFSIGAGGFYGREANGNPFYGPIFEVGGGARLRILGHFYLGLDAEWIDLEAGSIEGMIGFEL